LYLRSPTIEQPISCEALLRMSPMLFLILVPYKDNGVSHLTMDTLDDGFNKPVRVGSPGIFLNVRNVGAASGEAQDDSYSKEQNVLDRQRRPPLRISVNQISVHPIANCKGQSPLNREFLR